MVSDVRRKWWIPISLLILGILTVVPGAILTDADIVGVDQVKRFNDLVDWLKGVGAVALFSGLVGIWAVARSVSQSESSSEAERGTAESVRKVAKGSTHRCGDSGCRVPGDDDRHCCWTWLALAAHNRQGLDIPFRFRWERNLNGCELFRGRTPACIRRSSNSEGRWPDTVLCLLMKQADKGRARSTRWWVGSDW